MAKDLFGLGGLGGALGGLVGGLAKSGLVNKDDPSMKAFTAQSELADLQKQEAEILQEIGRAAFEKDPSAWPQADKLKLLRANIAEAEGAAEKAKQEAEAAKQAKDAENAAKAAADAIWRCPSCGHQNPEGTKFCQECGAKLGKTFCTACGAELAPGTRFCGACGAKQEG